MKYLFIQLSILNQTTQTSLRTSGSAPTLDSVGHGIDSVRPLDRLAKQERKRGTDEQLQPPEGRLVRRAECSEVLTGTMEPHRREPSPVDRPRRRLLVDSPPMCHRFFRSSRRPGTRRLARRTAGTVREPPERRVRVGQYPTTWDPSRRANGLDGERPPVGNHDRTSGPRTPDGAEAVGDR